MQLNVYNREPMGIALARQDFKKGLERKLFYLILNQLKTGLHLSTDLFKNTEIKIYLKHLNDKNYERIKQAARNFNKRQIQLINDKDSKFTYITPFPEVSYASGVLTFTIYDKVIPHFIELSNGYSEYQISIMNSFSSEYTQRMYEILSGKKRLNDGVWKRVEVESLKRILNAEGYTLVGNFCQKVLDVAEAEMKEKGDIYFEYEKIKTGRKITHLTFTVYYADDQENFQTDLNKDIEVFNELDNSEKAQTMRDMVNEYKFSENQKTLIMGDPELFTKFFEVNKKIRDGVLTEILDKTKYMATTLGFNKKS